jgi:hypothetical protein
VGECHGDHAADGVPGEMNAATGRRAAGNRAQVLHLGFDGDALGAGISLCSVAEQVRTEDQGRMRQRNGTLAGEGADQAVNEDDGQHGKPACHGLPHGRFKIIKWPRHAGCALYGNCSWFAAGASQK